MNTPDAENLARRIQATWRNGPTADIWTDVLAELNAKQAEETYRRLRDEADHAPTVATFKARYRSLTASEPADAQGCSRCDGYGWLERIEEHHGHRYTFAVPCTCPAGKAHAPVVERIVAANTRPAT
jgi:hypothetical protein